LFARICCSLTWLTTHIGPLWGESGYIRLKRVDPDSLEDPDSDCGLDKTPMDGNACTKDENGNDVEPPAVKICGTSGVLSTSTIPLGAFLIDKPHSIAETA
jgi:hypothetical protein